MTVNPAIDMGFTPCGVSVDAAQSSGDNFLLLLMPETVFGFGHHFVCADDTVTGLVQETVEK